MDKGLNIMKKYEKIERVFTKDDTLIDNDLFIFKRK